MERQGLDPAGKIFEQIAGWVTELAAFKLGQIGRLDRDETAGTHRVIHLSEVEAKWFKVLRNGTAVPDGPFNTAYPYYCVIHC